MNGSFCNLCVLALWLALHIFASQCSRAPKKGEKAVHYCDPALSVLVMFLSRNVFHAVSVLQSTVFTQNFVACWRPDYTGLTEFHCTCKRRQHTNRSQSLSSSRPGKIGDPGNEFCHPYSLHNARTLTSHELATQPRIMETNTNN